MRTRFVPVVRFQVFAAFVMLLRAQPPGFWLLAPFLELRELPQELTGHPTTTRAKVARQQTEPWIHTF